MKSPNPQDYNGSISFPIINNDSPIQSSSTILNDIGSSNYTSLQIPSIDPTKEIQKQNKSSKNKKLSVRKKFKLIDVDLNNNKNVSDIKIVSSIKKRKDITPSIDPITNVKIKKVKLNGDRILFPFIKFDNNSCAFDSLLGLIYQFHKDNFEIMNYIDINIMTSLKIIFKLIEDIKFVDAQNQFINLLIASQISDSKIGNFKDILMFIEKLFANLPNEHKLKINNTYKCENNRCPIKKDSSKNNDQFYFLLDSSLIDYRDISNGLLESLLGRYTIHNRDDGICECNSTKRKNNKKEYRFEDLNILEYIPSLFVINIEAINMINSEENKEFDSKFIEENYQFTFNNKLIKIELIAIIFLENNSHFTIAYKNPKFKNDYFSNWSYYDDINTNFREYFALNLQFKSLISSNRKPIFLFYKT